MSVPIPLTPEMVETRFTNIETAISRVLLGITKIENEQVVLNSEIGTIKSTVEVEITKEQNLMKKGSKLKS